MVFDYADSIARPANGPKKLAFSTSLYANSKGLKAKKRCNPADLQVAH